MSSVASIKTEIKRHFDLEFVMTLVYFKQYDNTGKNYLISLNIINYIGHNDFKYCLHFLLE